MPPKDSNKQSESDETRLNRKLDQFLEEVRSSAVPPRLSELAEELQRLIDRKNRRH